MNIDKEKLREPLLYKITRPIITILVKIIFHPHIIGRENISRREGLILAGNHTSYFDPLLLIASTNRCIHFLAKDDLVKGVKKIIFKNMGIIPVDRSKKNPLVVSLAIKSIKENQVIGIFPEGTINRRKKEVIMPFKMGAVKIAKDSEGEIIPFAITGKYKLFKGNLKIVFGKPLKVKGDLIKENEKLEKFVTELIERS